MCMIFHTEGIFAAFPIPKQFDPSEGPRTLCGLCSSLGDLCVSKFFLLRETKVLNRGGRAEQPQRSGRTGELEAFHSPASQHSALFSHLAGRTAATTIGTGRESL